MQFENNTVISSGKSDIFNWVDIFNCYVLHTYSVADQIRKRGFSKERTKRNETPSGNTEDRSTVRRAFQNCSGDAGATSAAVTRGGGTQPENKPAKTHSFQELLPEQLEIQDSSIPRSAVSLLTGAECVHCRRGQGTAPAPLQLHQSRSPAAQRCLVHSDTILSQKRIQRFFQSTLLAQITTLVLQCKKVMTNTLRLTAPP